MAYIGLRNVNRRYGGIVFRSGHDHVPEGVAVWLGERLYGEVFRLKIDLTESDMNICPGKRTT